MNLEKLSRFIFLEKFNSLSEAARSGKLSQSTWSRDIDTLKKNFQVKLINRCHKGIALTKEVKILFEITNNFNQTLKNFKITNSTSSKQKPQIESILECLFCFLSNYIKTTKIGLYC